MIESTRRPGAPTLPLTPVELLTPKEGEGYSWGDKYVGTIAATVACGFSPCLNNWMLKRPAFAGIYNHIILGAIGYFVADKVFEYRRQQKAERDAILLHYISLHPEDFPPIERQKYKDLFLPWSPIR